MKKPTSPIIHGLSLMKTYTAHGLKLHIATHRKGKDKDLVKQWEGKNEGIESCYVKSSKK